ncbi:MAG: chemotaxis-specific protein-glutamate methyltransferase CheB [bacterium]|nr:chemotaxis-specific protein-glutamate methyltransferase CheB [bacterium]
MKLGVVNDLRIALEAMRRLIESTPRHEIVWTASTGEEAVMRCRENHPDVVLMDLQMPVMDGAEATRRIMSESPCAILIVTASVEGSVSKVFEAMGNGALDAVRTPTLGDDGSLEGGAELLKKLDRLEKLIGGASAKKVINDEPSHSSAHTPTTPLIVLGASTGGPRALASVLSALTGDTPAAVVMVQHVDPQFAGGLADWLGNQSAMMVRCAIEDQVIEPGCAYLAARSEHLVIGPDLRLHYQREPVDAPYRPSVDIFFYSAAQRWPSPGAAALLSGMGKDGAKGLLALKQAGWKTITQDAETSVVYGMPKAAVELGGSGLSLPVDEIGAALRKSIANARLV